MSLEDLKSSLLSEAKQEADRILKNAESEANQLISTAEKDSKAELERVKAELEEKIDVIKSEKLAAAKLDAKKIVAEGKEAAVLAAIDALYEELKNFTKTKRYGDWLSRLAKEAEKELGKDIIIHVRKGHGKYLKSKKVVEDLDSVGGLIAETKDGSVRLNLTFESIISKKEDLLRASIAKMLFGGRK